MPRTNCAHCSRPAGFCYCHLLCPINNKWPVRILQHSEESKHPFNTARIATLSLQDCLLHLTPDVVDDTRLCDVMCQTSIQPVLIYPRQDVPLLSEAPLPPGTPLLFIDASWRKSKRVLLQSALLQNLACRCLLPATPPRYRIRKEPRPHYRSTLESIVSALTILGDEGAQPMLDIMDWMIERQLQVTKKSNHFVGAGRT
jgi:DTW domain-containing protein